MNGFLLLWGAPGNFQQALKSSREQFSAAVFSHTPLHPPLYVTLASLGALFIGPKIKLAFIHKKFGKILVKNAIVIGILICYTKCTN